FPASGEAAAQVVVAWRFPIHGEAVPKGLQEQP
ncbi:MAG: hypothetical protein RL230_390, partial [Pseudomonadota bacterium]